MKYHKANKGLHYVDCTMLPALAMNPAKNQS